MADNKRLQNAKTTKNDEFYTQYSSIADEMGHYRKQLEGQVIYCNCDDPTWSEFWRYFHSNFCSLKLRKLIATHYQKNSEPSYAMIYEGGDDFNMDAGDIIEINGNSAVIDGEEVFYTAGDFRSDECVNLLKEATLVVTNPPFSLFREYIAQLIEYKKKFIIIGNKNAVTYKEVFPLIKENKMWIGYRSMNSDFWFRVPEDAPCEKIVNGTRLKHIMGCWFTNMDVKYRHDGLWHKNGKFDNSQAHSYYEGNEDAYIHFDNFDAIDISIEKSNGKREGSCDIIPIDYEGMMAVPITIFDKYNPDELEIIGVPTGKSGASIGVKRNYRGRTDIAFTQRNGKPTCPFSRVIVRNRNPIKKSDDIGY